MKKRKIKNKRKKINTLPIFLISDIRSIFTRNAAVFPHVILTEEGAITLLNKINEIINYLNEKNQT